MVRKYPQVRVSPATAMGPTLEGLLLGFIRDEHNEHIAVIDCGHGLLLEQAHPSRVKFLPVYTDPDSERSGRYGGGPTIEERNLTTRLDMTPDFVPYWDGYDDVRSTGVLSGKAEFSGDEPRPGLKSDPALDEK